MKQLTIISGKGGTGKTTITAAFASLAKNAVLADADVDAADLYLILNPDIKSQEEFYGGYIPVIDRGKCTECEVCEELCRFDAINDFAIDDIACEGCGLCALACPSEAIKMERGLSGHLFTSQTRFGPMVYARLGVAQENSGKLVSLVRQRAREIAEKEGRNLIIVDGPPGIGCPVIASIGGVDMVLVVTEPTISGIHDMERIAGVAKHFKVPALVCINKYDINMENSTKIELCCRENGIEIVGNLPYDVCVTKAMVQGKSIIESDCGQITSNVKVIWEKVQEVLNGRQVKRRSG